MQMNRKNDHIKYALEQDVILNDFDKIRFVHRAIPKISINDISLKTTICGRDIDVPIYINAMTGGTDKSKQINEKLAIIADHFQIPIATGSMSIALKDPDLIETFTIIRKNNPNGLVMGNLGADKSVGEAKKAIEMVDADIMQIHLNAIQEIIMPEGERDFTSWYDNLKTIIQEVSVPVIVKEVGFGMSRYTISGLKAIGVNTIDISGRGGTNFAIIENKRRENKMDYFNNWGLSTVESLLEATTIKDIEILASGGIRNAMDIVKALALGANAVGLSSFFLKLVTGNTIEVAIEKTQQLINDIKSIMTILGITSVKNLKRTEIIVDESIYNFMKQRKIEDYILLYR
jgi:isopentenyl-diphosphate delta-isomerase